MHIEQTEGVILLNVSNPESQPDSTKWMTEVHPMVVEEPAKVSKELHMLLEKWMEMEPPVQCCWCQYGQRWCCECGWYYRKTKIHGGGVRFLKKYLPYFYHKIALLLM